MFVEVSFCRITLMEAKLDEILMAGGKCIPKIYNSVEIKVVHCTVMVLL